MSDGTLEGLYILKELGFSRAVLPRELSFEEIKHLCEHSPIDLEVFIHGALCMCVSGQCLMSAVLGSRSGNRGLCAQPCRLPFKAEKGTGHDLSLKDLSLIEHIPELAKLGVCSFKIEGRMRNKEYLAIVISNYRKALNKLKSGKEMESEEISLVFNRGFSQGQFNNTSKRSLRAGHVGLKIGKVIDARKNQIAIKIDDSIKNIPEKGDGLLLVKNDNDYGNDGIIFVFVK